jgi:hypothetical protein
MRMTRKICILLGLLIAFVSFLCVPQGQTQEKKWKKTVTLPNGEVILDISGEWDVLVENYGEWSRYGSYPQKENITLEGSSFVGTRMIDDPYNKKGSVQIRGELGKSGFKRVSLISVVGAIDATGKISDGGNKLVLDAKNRSKLTLTRK